MSDFEFRRQAYDHCPKCGSFVDTRGGPQSGRLCIKCAADTITRLRAEKAELVEALDLIIGRSRFNNEEEWMDFVDAIELGRDALARAQSDPHDSEGETG